MFDELGLNATPTFYIIHKGRKVQYEGPLDPQKIAQFVVEI